MKGSRSRPPTCRRDVARDLLADLRRMDRQVKDSEAEMREAVGATRTTLTTFPGLGTVLAAKVLGHIGDYTGSAPLNASSGNNVPHRLNTGGNRALNSALHTNAVCQLRDGGRGQATTSARSARERRHWRPAGPSHGAFPMWSTGS
ncbi:transposase [Streptomyces gardneri]|uniref:transposase n=1 Tax=Streptomyces gardneri TaxID=66892 RepID=UPI0036B1BAB7